eukprot:jgi/Chrzof1/11243/Cz05g29060.t1_ATPD
MLRQAANRLLRQGLRSISTSSAPCQEGAAAAAGAKEFIEEWNKSAPSTLAPPELPTNFLPKEPSAEPAGDERFQLNFYTPTGVVAENKVRR